MAGVQVDLSNQKQCAGYFHYDLHEFESTSREIPVMPDHKKLQEHQQNDKCQSILVSEKGKLMPVSSFSAAFKSHNIQEDKCPVVAQIHYEHDYTKHWSLKSESHDGSDCESRHPMSTWLFAQKSQDVLERRYQQHHHEEELVDVEGDWSDGPATLICDEKKAAKLMDECERHVDFAGQLNENTKQENEDENVPSGIEDNDNVSEHSVTDDEKSVNCPDTVRQQWSRQQNRIFDKAVRILDGERLARLSLFTVRHEPVKRRALLDRSSNKFRRLLSCVCRWDTDLCCWLHNTMLSTLSRPYLVAYLDILQSLRYLMPTLLDKLWTSNTKPITAGKATAGKVIGVSNAVSGAAIGGINIGGGAGANQNSGSPIVGGANVLENKSVVGIGGSISNLGLSLLLKRPWDPALSTLHQHKPTSLSSRRCPVLVPVPCSPQSGGAQSRRLKGFTSLLQHLTTVTHVSGIIYSADAGLEAWLESVVCAVRAKLSDLRARGRPAVLLGWGPAALLALQISTVEPSVAGIVCLALPFSAPVNTKSSAKQAQGNTQAQEDSNDNTTDTGVRDFDEGGGGDTVSTLETLQSVTCPVLLVQGDRAANCSIPALESSRPSFSSSSRLVVVCGGNARLRLSALHRYQAALTHSIVDRCIVDEIGIFLLSLMPEDVKPNLSHGVTAAADDSCEPGGGAAEGVVGEGDLSRKRRLSGGLVVVDASAMDGGSRPPTPKRARVDGTGDVQPLPPKQQQQGSANINSTSSSSGGGGVATFGGIGSATLVLVSSGVPVVAGGDRGGAPGASVVSSPLGSTDMTSWQNQSPLSTSATPTPVRGSGPGRRGRRPGRGRGRGGRALPPEQLFALGGGVGVAAQAHINSAGRRQSPAFSRTPRGSKAGGRGAALPNLQPSNLATSGGIAGYVITQKSGGKSGEVVQLTHPHRGVLSHSHHHLYQTGKMSKASLKEQMAQASQSEAQLLAAVASITPQSTHSSPVQIPMDNNITTISTSTAIMQQLTEPVTIIQQQQQQQQQHQHVQFQIHPQPVSLSTTGSSYVVSSIAGSQGHPVVASVLGSVIDTNASGCNRRKSGAAAIISSSASNIQKNSIIFQTSPDISGTSNRIILPNSISGNSTAKFVSSASVSTTPCGTRPIRPNITISQHQRLGSPVVLASTSHKAVSALSGNISRAGHSPGITTTVYSGRVGVTTAGTTTVNITDMQTLQSVQNLLSGAKFITTSGVSAGGIAGRGSRGGSVTVRGGVAFSRGGGSGGIIGMGRGRGITLVNPRGVGAAGGCISSIRNITPTAKRQMITVSGSSGIKIGTGHTTTYGVRGTNLVLASVPVSSPTASVSSTAAPAAFASSPGSVDASTCTSPSLVSFSSIGDSNVCSAAPVQQQGQIILQLHQQKLQQGVILQQQQQAQGQQQVACLGEQSRPKQILYRPVTLQNYQQQKQALSMPKLTLHQEDLLVSQRNNAELLKVTPHHVIKTNTSVKTVLPKENLDDSIIEINSFDGDTSGQSATTTDAEEVVVPVAGHASKSASATAVSTNLASEGTLEVARATIESTGRFNSKTTAAVTTDALVGCSVSTAPVIGTTSSTTVNESLSRARAAVRYVTASSFPSVKCVSVTSVQTALQGGGHGPVVADTEVLQKGKFSSNQYPNQLETLDCILDESYPVTSVQPSVAFAYSTHPSRITIEQATVDKTGAKPLHGNEFSKEDNFGESSRDVEIIEKVPRVPTTSEESSSKDRPHKVIITKPTLSLIKVLTATPSLSETKVLTSEGSSHSQNAVSAKFVQTGKLLPTGKQSGSVLLGRSSAAAFNVKPHTHKSPIHQVVSSKALTASSVFQNTNEGNKVQSSTTTSNSFPSLQISDAHPFQASSQLIQEGCNFSSVVSVSASSKSVSSSLVALKQETSSILDATSPMRSIASASSPSIMTVGASEAFAVMKATVPGSISGQKAVVHLGPPVSVVSVSTASAAATAAVAVSVSSAASSLPASEENVTDDLLHDIIAVESVSPMRKITRNTKPSAVHIISTSQAFAYKGKTVSNVEPAEGNKVITAKSQSKPNRILVSKASAMKFQQLGVSAVRRGSLPNIVSGLLSTASDDLKHLRKLSGSSSFNNRELGSPEAQKTVQETEATHEGDLILETSDNTNKAFDNNNKAAAVDGSSKASATVSSGTFYKPSLANLALTEKFNQKQKEATLHGEKRSVSSKREPTKISVQDAINISTVKSTEGKKSVSDNVSRVSFVLNTNMLMAQSQHLSKTASTSPSPSTSKCVEVIVVSKKLTQAEIPDKNEQSVKTVDSISSISNEKANLSSLKTKSCVASGSLGDTEVPPQLPQLLGKIATGRKKSGREVSFHKSDFLNPEAAGSFSNLQKIDVDVIVQSELDQNFIGVPEIQKNTTEIFHQKDNSSVEIVEKVSISLNSTSTPKKMLSNSPLASTRASSAQPPGNMTDNAKSPLSVSDKIKKSLTSGNGNDNDLSNTLSTELPLNLGVLPERRRTTSESPTSSPKLSMPLRSRVNSQSRLSKDSSKVAGVKDTGKKTEEDSNVEIKVEIDDSDGSFSMADPKPQRSRTGVTSSNVEDDVIKTRRKSATKSAVEQNKYKPVEAEAQISTEKNTATPSKVSKTVLVPGVSGSSTAGRTKQPLGLLMKHTGRGGHLCKGKTRASPRLSLTPYEQAAMLRSGRKRTSL